MLLQDSLGLTFNIVPLVPHRTDSDIIFVGARGNDAVTNPKYQFNAQNVTLKEDNRGSLSPEQNILKLTTLNSRFFPLLCRALENPRNISLLNLPFPAVVAKGSQPSLQGISNLCMLLHISGESLSLGLAMEENDPGASKGP